MQAFHPKTGKLTKGGAMRVKHAMNLRVILGKRYDLDWLADVFLFGYVLIKDPCGTKARSACIEECTETIDRLHIIKNVYPRKEDEGDEDWKNDRYDYC